MKISQYIPIKSVTQAIIAGIIVLIVGLLLYFYFQPQCPPCLPGIKCAPCTSKGQRTVIFVTIFVELVILAKGMLGAPATPEQK